MWVLLWHSDLDVNVVISVAVAVHPPNAFPLQPDHLISLATGRNLKKQLTLKTENRQQKFPRQKLCVGKTKAVLQLKYSTGFN